MEHRTLCDGVSVALILRLNSERVEAKEAMGHDPLSIIGDNPSDLSQAGSRNGAGFRTHRCSNDTEKGNGPCPHWFNVAAILARRLDAANRWLVAVKRQLETGEPPGVIGKAIEKVEELISYGGRDPTGW
jgi:hypothetical protein